MIEPTPTVPTYELKKVRYAYEGKYLALDRVDLLIMPEEKVAVLGANRSGKTTLLRLLGGLIHPAEGTLLYEGRSFNPADPRDLPSFGQFLSQVGYVSEDSDLRLQPVTVLAHLFHHQSVDFRSRMNYNDIVNEVLAMLGLGDIGNRNTSALSRGERKLVDIARVLCSNSRILILDEPMPGLDHCVRKRLLELLKWLGHGGKTIILAGHDLELAEQFANRVIILGDDHRIVSDGPPKEVLRNYNFLFKSSLLGEHLSEKLT
jgi:cobalt/nickel transport system ATP-binding protein